MGFRGRERVTGVHHTTIIGWVKIVGFKLNNLDLTGEIPEITQIDERRQEIGAFYNWINKRNKSKAPISFFRSSSLGR